MLAATNKDLTAAIQSGEFREDLFYRIKVIPIHLPALRDRKEDIPLLAAHLVQKIGARINAHGSKLSTSCLERMLQYNWPGNIRELINALEYAITLAPNKRIRADDLPPEITGNRDRYNMKKQGSSSEPDIIRKTLLEADGNRSKAARVLGMNRVTLYRKMKRYGIE